MARRTSNSEASVRGVLETENKTRRDHTSMMHGYQKISEMMNADKDLRAQVKGLIRNLHPES